ncbi:MAG: sigma-70 family RNA polymerase sigma factor [Candidatus Omnitrophica bacterium]|nr:sigma-70 family RNA polymerase sigma factor [Candidatus Omnitrophota bacterium]
MKEQIKSLTRQEGPEEDELVLKAQSGDKHAFEELVRQNQQKILSLCFRLLGDAQAAEELAADAFAESYRSLKKFKRKAQFGTWLYRIALNLGYNRLRKATRERRLFDSPNEATAHLQDQTLPSEVATSRPNPLETLEQDELRSQIRSTLARLSKDQAQILILRDVECLSYAEVSELLKCSLGTVMSRLSRAREAFRKKWNQHSYLRD